MRILHTADWQLGAKQLQAGDRAHEVREQRLATVETISALVHEEDVDAVLVVGDTFEDHDVDERVVRRAVQALEAMAPVPVFVLPGNHDPLVPGGVWDRRSWKQVQDHEHVRLLTAREPVALAEDAVLLPCPLTQKRSTQDPTDWIPAREGGDERIRVGLAHGALDILGEPMNFPIDPGRPASADLDYLALGDWHGLYEHGRAAYPGTPEATAYGEKDPGHVLLVDLPGPGAEPVLEPRRVGLFTWSGHDVDVRDETDVEVLRRELEALDRPSDTLVRVKARLTASASDEAARSLEALKTWLVERVHHLDWVLDDTAFLSQRPVELPDGVLAQADDTLATLLDGRIPEGPGQGFASADPDVVAEARALLHELAREVDH